MPLGRRIDHKAPPRTLTSSANALMPSLLQYTELIVAHNCSRLHKCILIKFE